MEKLSQLCGGFLLCSLLASFAYQSKRLSDNMQARFITSAYMCGLFFYCHEIIFFDPKYKIFGVMANVLISVGAVTGGVVGKYLYLQMIMYQNMVVITIETLLYFDIIKFMLS